MVLGRGAVVDKLAITTDNKYIWRYYRPIGTGDILALVMEVGAANSPATTRADISSNESCGDLLTSLELICRNWTPFPT